MQEKLDRSDARKVKDKYSFVPQSVICLCDPPKTEEREKKRDISLIGKEPEY